MVNDTGGFGLNYSQLKWYNGIASGQKSAPCRVIVGLRSAQSYIPWFFIFSMPLQPRPAAFFVCNTCHSLLTVYRQYPEPDESMATGR